MGRRIVFYGIAAIILVLILAGLLRRCAKGAVEPAPQPPLTFAPLKKRAMPERSPAPKRSGLVAPQLLNLGALQINIRKYYPEAEHQAGVGGRVTLALVVGADGSVSDVRIAASGGVDFDEAAKRVVLAMRFAPARKAGKPVAVEIDEVVDFQFDKK
jgi:TonB family protein